MSSKSPSPHPMASTSAQAEMPSTSNGGGGGMEWHPQHLHEVVAVAMVVKHWLRPRDRAKERERNEEIAATNEVNTSLVFEPMAITMERIRVLKEMGRTPSRNSLLALRSSAKVSSATLMSAASPVEAASPKQSSAEVPVPAETMPSTTTDGQEGQMREVVVQVGEGIGTEATDADDGGSGNNGNVLGGRRVEPTETNTTVGQQRELLEQRAAVPLMERIGNWGRTAGRTLGALPRASVDPGGDFYAFWTFFIYLVFLYNAFMCVIFIFDDTQDNAFFGFWLIFNGLSDGLNLLDLLLNSRLSYMDDGMLIQEWRRLTKRYLRSWHFPLDLLALAPFDLLLLANRNISLVRLNRLVKCYRVWQFVQMTNVRTNYPNAFRILHIMVVCMVLFHWNAALYFKISLFYGTFSTDFSAWEFNFVKNQDPIWVDCGRVLWDEIGEGECGFNESGRGDPDTERVNYVPEMANYWRNRSEPIHFSNFSKQYSLSFYWSSLTLTTSGQQPYPTAALHNFLEIFDTIVGVLVFAVIVGSVGNVVTTMNRGRAEIQQLNDGIKFYMNYRNVSDAMQKRVLDCIHYIQRHAQIQNEQSIMGTIPPRLRGELAVHLHMETLRRVELFAECEPALLYEFVMRLRMQMFAPNDFLCRRGDLAKEMYLVKRGALEVFSERGEQLRLFQGNAFGEMSILKPGGPLGKLLARRHHSLRSLGYSEVYLLGQDDALAIFADYPEQRHALIQRAIDLMIEQREMGADDLVGQGALSPVELCGTESTIEVLQLLEGTLQGLDAKLDTIYADFTHDTSDLKKQVTALEASYREGRQLMEEKKKRRE